MENRKTKIARFFSAPLMKQNIKSNAALTIAIIIIMCMMCTVVSFATNMLATNTDTTDKTESQEDFYMHLFAIASYNQMTQGTLSPDDFMKSEDKSTYETVFEMLNAQSNEIKLSVESFESSILALQDEDGLVDSYVEQFEYIYALSDETGVFTNNELSIDNMMTTMLSAMGFDSEQLENMSKMDTTAMLTKMYFTVIGLLPIFLYIVLVGNSLIVNQVDSGSMAYVLATPTKRSAVANTQAFFLVVVPFIICSIVCAVRCFVWYHLNGEVNVAANIALYLGMYLLIQAVGGICYMGSCIFNQTGKATAFGGGLAVWFFLASLLGMFGSEDMVTMGVGLEELNIFNKLTLVGLYDINALATIGTDAVDTAFIPKLCILAAIAIVTYIVGNITFQKKDLPL